MGSYTDLFAGFSTADFTIITMHKASVFRRSPSEINKDAQISLSHAQSLCESNKSLSIYQSIWCNYYTHVHTFIHSRVPTLLLLNCYSILLARFFSFLGIVIIPVRLRNYCLPSSVSVSLPSLSTQLSFFFFSLASTLTAFTPTIACPLLVCPLLCLHFPVLYYYLVLSLCCSLTNSTILVFSPFAFLASFFYIFYLVASFLRFKC